MQPQIISIDNQGNATIGCTMSFVRQGYAGLITCVLSASTAQIYVDGQPITQTVSTVGAVPSNSSAYTIGGNTGTEDYGTLTDDDVRVYNRALSAGEVLDLYRMGNTTGGTNAQQGTWLDNMINAIGNLL
jgi:hypothetical protein